MAKYRMSTRVAVGADDLVARMSDPREQEAVFRHFGATAAKSRREETGPGKARLETETEEPARFGGGSDRSVFRVEWDLKARSSRFTREDLSHGDRVKVTGGIRIEPDGDGACVIHDEGEILIYIPRVGGQVAKQIVALMERQQPERCKYWETRMRG